MDLTFKTDFIAPRSPESTAFYIQGVDSIFPDDFYS